MPDTTVFATTDPTEADDFIGLHKAAGEKVIRIAKPNRVRLLKDGDSPIFWNSGASDDWIVLIATREDVDTP